MLLVATCLEQWPNLTLLLMLPWKCLRYDNMKQNCKRSQIIIIDWYKEIYQHGEYNIPITATKFQWYWNCYISFNKEKLLLRTERFNLEVSVLSYSNFIFVHVQECFQPKDYLNMRYHHKRALYLTVVASKLIKSKMFASVNFTRFNGEILKPILLLKPKGTEKLFSV